MSKLKVKTVNEDMYNAATLAALRRYMLDAKIPSIAISEPLDGDPFVICVKRDGNVTEYNYGVFLLHMGQDFTKEFNDKYPNDEYIPSCRLAQCDEDIFNEYCRYILTQRKLMEVIS